MSAVYIVYTEYQRDSPSIDGVYATRAAADEARAALVEDAQARGEVVYNEDPEDRADWDVDIHVEEHPVEGDQVQDPPIAAAPQEVTS